MTTTTTTTELTEREKRIVTSANIAGLDSVGKKYTVRKADNSGTITGIITRCVFSYFNNRGDVIWKIVMECGSAKREREVFLKRIPMINYEWVNPYM